jgi:endonuclease-8
VEAVGKHLVVRFDDGHLLRTHLRMTGSWHLYRPGERWRKPAHLARVVLEVGEWVAVCFSAPVVVVERERRSAPTGTAAPVPGRDDDRPASLAHLGPDLCVPGADLDEALLRMASVPDPGTTIAEVLLDQRVAAGIGNVYKSEVLWARRVDPFAPVGRLGATARRGLLERAHRLLLANLTTSRRTTIPGPPGSLAVYGRAGRPCPACGTPVRSRRHGERARSTWWCPRCQPPLA